MLSLHPVMRIFNKLASCIAIAALLIVLASVVDLSGRRNAEALAKSNVAANHMAFFAYWSEKNGFQSSVLLNNSSGFHLTVAPMLFNLSGEMMIVQPLVIGPQQQLTAKISEWIAKSDAQDKFKEGNLILTYDGPNGGFLGAQVTVTKPDSGISFDVRNEMPMSYHSSRLEGMWWLPDNASRYDLVISNMESGEAVVTITLPDDRMNNGETAFNITLAPHQTQIINLNERAQPFRSIKGVGKIGGISITHTNAPGTVIAHGLLSKAQTGFSSRFTFEDPAAVSSQTLASAHLMIGKPDLPGLPAQSLFTSIAFLRNTSDAVINVKPSVSFAHNNMGRTVSLPARQLQPRAIESLDVGAELKRLRINGQIKGAGLSLTSTGKPGDLMASVTSFDQTSNHSFDVPMKDPAVAMNRFSGSYPWDIGGDTQTIIHVRNTANERARFTIQLDHEGGSYTLPMQELEPQQQAAIDVRQLRDAQVPDSLGRVIPDSVTSGQATWMEHGAQPLIGRSEIFSASKGIASSFSCPIGCCPAGDSEVYLDPGFMSGVVGDTCVAKLFLMRSSSNCTGLQYGPYNVTTQASWSSDTTSVAQIISVASTGCRISCVSAGEAIIQADFSGVCIQLTPFDTCEQFGCMLSDGDFMAVAPKIDSISPDKGVRGLEYGVTIRGGGFATGATVSAGNGISVQVDAVTSGEILATFTIAGNAAGGNRNVTVTVNGMTSNSVNFKVQIPSRVAIETLNNVVVIDPGPGEIRGPDNNVVASNQCGAYRTIVYQVVDQDGAAIVDQGTANEVVRDTTTNAIVAQKSHPTDENGRFGDVLAISRNHPSCPAVNEGATLRQTFSFELGQNTFNLTTVNRIEFKKNSQTSYTISLTAETQ